MTNIAFQVHCKKCSACLSQKWASTEEEAAKLWNIRAASIIESTPEMIRSRLDYLTFTFSHETRISELTLADIAALYTAMRSAERLVRNDGLHKKSVL